MLWRRFAEWLSTPTGRRRATDAAVLAVVFVFVGIAYGPSLKHPPRADQWCFLTDTIDDHTFLDTLRHSYSYNRTRLTAPGDTDLFRPLLFALLAAEKVAFEGDLALAQGFGVVLHCAACALLLVLLRQTAAIVRPAGSEDAEPTAGRDRLIHATVAFFALNPYVQELVIWGHLHGYLLFLLFLLGSVSCLLRYATDAHAGKPAAGFLAVGWGLALLAAFTYELGQFYALLAGAFVACAAVPRVGTKRAACLFAVFAAVPVIYQTANRIDQRVHRGQYTPDELSGVMARQALAPATVEHAARYGVYTAAQPFFPSLIQPSYSGQRLQIAETVWAVRRLKTLSPALAVSFAALGAAALLALAGLWRLARDRSRLPLLALLLPAGLCAGYGAMTVLGRMNMRSGPHILSSNSYYAYTGMLFALFAAAAAWHAVGGWAGRVRTALAVTLLALTALGAEQVWRANVTVSQSEREQTRALRAVQEFVNAHRHEPGFSFEIDYAASDPVMGMYGRPITLIVFSRWMSAPEPSYRIALRDGKAQPCDARVATRPPATP